MILRKTLLLNTPPLLANKKIFLEYSGDYSREKYDYFTRAKLIGEILEIDCYTRNDLGKNKQQPRYRIFIDRHEEKYETFDTYDNKWRTARICALEGLHRCWGKKNTYASTKDIELVNDYFDTGAKLDIEAAVLNFQSKILGSKLKKKHRNELEQIDEVMNQIPDRPHNLEKWILKNCFSEVCFYKPADKYKWPKMYCTHCGTWSDCPGKPEHNKEVTCPKCRTKAVYKSWNKQKYADQRTDVAVLQRLMDDSGWILRSFDCKLERHGDKGWENQELKLHENVRARLSDNFIQMELFEWGEYKYSGVYRWCHIARNTMWGYYSPREFGITLMYTANLKRVLKGTGIENMDFKKIFRVEEKARVSPDRCLYTMLKYPFIEYMQKMKMDALVQEIMQYTYYSRTVTELVNPEGKRLTEVLRLDKQRVRKLANMDGDRHILCALQYEGATGSRISDENLEYCRENSIYVDQLPLEKTGMTAERMLNYLKKQQNLLGMEFDELRRMYLDYLDMAEVLGADIKDEIVCHTSDLRGWHDKYVEEKNRKQARYRDTEVNKKYSQIKADYEENRKHFAWENEELVMLVPRRASDITKEGRVQHHCVGASDTYISKMNEKRSFILFLRHKDRPKEAYYTIECRWNGKILQWYGAYDRKPDKEKIDAVLGEWTEEIGKRTKKLLDKQVKAIEADGLKAIIKNEGAIVYGEYTDDGVSPVHAG